MFMQILQRTPFWVWLILVVLLALGFTYSKTRMVSRSRLVIVPLVMLGLSFSGVLQAFGASVLALAAWLLGFAAIVAIGLKCEPTFFDTQGAYYVPNTRQFGVPGSWWPLAWMMSIFVLKYAVGVLQGMHHSVTLASEFSACISAAYGLLSGAFFVRALLVWRTRNKSNS